MLNSVSLVGSLASSVEDLEHAGVSCRLCLEETGKDGQTYRTYVGVEALGNAASVLKACEEGDLLAVTGRLVYRSWTKDGKRQGLLKVATWQATRLSRHLAEAVA